MIDKLNNAWTFFLVGLVFTSIGAGGLTFDWWRIHKQKAVTRQKFAEFEKAVYETAKRA